METAIEREKRLKICTGVLVSKVVFSGIGSEGKRRAEVVSFQHAHSKSGKTFLAKANTEVIICAGAISSPQILMLRSASLASDPSHWYFPLTSLLWWY
jgi:choline dehydrogenase-like flavoprotein